MDWSLLASAALSGLAVVAITWLAGRVGGTLGGLLATAPVTTTAAILYMGLDGQPVDVLHGARSLSAALVAMPAFFLVVTRTRHWPRHIRILLGLGVFVAIFTALGLAADAATPAGWQVVWVFVTLALAAGLGATFLQWHVPAAASKREMTTSWKEALLRFLAGAGVILLVDAMRGIHPTLGAAWAVFPGTFLVTLWVLGTDHDASLSAKASQGGVLGVPPLLAYLLTVHALQGLIAHPAWAWFVQGPAWIAYFAALRMVVRTMQQPATDGTHSSV